MNAGKSPQTRCHYPTTLLAMLKRAKAERVIKSHQLSALILPPAPTAIGREETDVLQLPAHRRVHIAQRGKMPAHLLAVVKMMGDTSVDGQPLLLRHRARSDAGTRARLEAP